MNKISSINSSASIQNFYSNKKVLLTGHTGFKGSWLSLWLQKLGAEVIGVSLEPPTIPNLYEQASVADGMTSLRGDIRDVELMKNIFLQHQPDIVFHLAAQPLVRYSYRQPVETYSTNVMGTLHILEAIRVVGSVRAVVMITTDKCYENREWDWGYRENEPMGGYDPYSSSKGCAELLIASYRNSYFPAETYSKHHTAIASARAGNVIGGGDWAEDRVIPDSIRAFIEKRPVNIRNPNAIRPWQHVLEPLSGYLKLAEQLWINGPKFAEGWNFGPYEQDAKSVEWIVKSMAEMWGEDARWEIDQGNHLHEANYLKLDCSKAHNRLFWQPRWKLSQALEKIVTWHKAILKQTDIYDMTIKQIEAYQNEIS